MAEIPLSLLCIEPRFPGRLGGVADWLVRKRGYRCDFYCHAADPQDHWPVSAGKEMRIVQFGVGGAARGGAVAWTRQLERGLCYAYGCQEVAGARNPRGVDLVLGRSDGLGSSLFIPAVLGKVPIVNFFDYYIQPKANDLVPEDAAQMPPEYFQWRRSANAMDLLDLENVTAAWIPTEWQRRQYPVEYQDDFHVLHDGVDLPGARPRSGSRSIAGRAIPAGTRVVTFVARSLDRMRGFDRFLELARRLQRARPDVLCVVIGDSLVRRGLDTKFFHQDYRAHLLERDPMPDPRRIWFLDFSPPAVVAEALAASDLHVYPGRVYPAARSLLEAMGAGAVVLASGTEPVREFIEHGRTGLLADTDHPEEWETLALSVLDDPLGHRSLGEAAASLIRERYSRDVTLPQLAQLFQKLAGIC